MKNQFAGHRRASTCGGKNKGKGVWRPQTLRRNVAEVRSAINRNAAVAGYSCDTHPFWNIDLERYERAREYPHIIVCTNLSADDNTIKLLKVELDSGSRVPKPLMNKMARMTGSGLLLCPTTTRFDKFIAAFKAIVETTKVTSDGIYLGLTKDVLEHGLVGPTFVAMDGTEIVFEVMY